MIPPRTLDVLDKHGGFNAVTMRLGHVKIVLDPVEGERPDRYPDDYQPGLIHPFVRWESRMVENGTLWRPGRVLKRSTVGELLFHDERSFYQTNNNVTRARYKVPGYRYQVEIYFDNATGERIA